MVHPKKIASILKNASEQGFVTSKYPIGKSPQGKSNPYSITSKGEGYLEKRWMLRFIENSDINEVRIPLKTFENALLKAEEGLDTSAMKISTPFGPEAKQMNKEDSLLVKETLEL